MKITYLHISNFKSIRDLEIHDIENALILVGKNNTGKTVVLDAVRAAAGEYKVDGQDYLKEDKNIVIDVVVRFEEEDLHLFHRKGIVSKYKKYELWEKDFRQKLPSFSKWELPFRCIIRKDGTIRYNDGYKKNNTYIPAVFPKVYHIDHSRRIENIQNEVLRFYDKQSLSDIKENLCIFDKAKKCNRCFQCIGLIKKKTPEELTIFETARLLEYKLFKTNMNEFAGKVNKYFHRNGGLSMDIEYDFEFDIERLFKVKTEVHNRDRETRLTASTLSEGLRSIYALSLLEAYIDDNNTIPCIIMIEDPEIYLHPQLQKAAGEILLRLSKKNQVIFSTHSPNMIFNFSTKQIKQIVLDKEYYTVANENADIDEILDDLGYTANDFMNVSFVFIVEGKQDSSRLPLLLEKYYSEIYDDRGRLNRISIISTNSCTNIKTYANLKYINKLYLKDQFLMIRDSDGKDPEVLTRQLCSYYKNRSKEDLNNLPRVTPENVLILKYYSFENYFLEPEVMVKIGVLKKEEDFYDILYEKYKEYLYKLSSVKKMTEKTGVRIRSKEDLRNNMEAFKIYVRGHNLFNIFYGKYHNNGETEILKSYIDAAPRKVFQDILDSIDSFVYFENRKKTVR